MENYTKISQEMHDIAVQLKTVEEAAKVLRETGKFRTMKSILQTITGKTELKKYMVDRLVPWNPKIARDSVRKKVDTWLKEQKPVLSKQDTYTLARALDFSLDETDYLLKQITGEGIHWRNPRDIAWCYAIVHQLNYAQVQSLLARVDALGDPANGPMEPTKKEKTEQVREMVIPALKGTEEELLAFLTEVWDVLGKNHNTAFALYSDYMKVLRQGYKTGDYESRLRELSDKEKKILAKETRALRETSRLEAEEKGLVYDPMADPHGQDILFRPFEMASRKILEENLYRKYIPVSSRGDDRREETFSAIQRSIRMYWPDEYAISGMNTRQNDVTRKVLMLLFLATDGGESEFQAQEPEIPEMDAWDDSWEPAPDPTPDEVFSSLETRMDLMLKACGYQQLDPRNPFDWMIIFCISSGDLWETDSLLRQTLQEMFPEAAEKAGETEETEETED